MKITIIPNTSWACLSKSLTQQTKRMACCVLGTRAILEQRYLIRQSNMSLQRKIRHLLQQQDSQTVSLWLFLLRRY